MSPFDSNIDHRFSRMELLVGNAGFKCLREASVAIFGLGGVGSYAAEALGRAGIGRLTLVDYDDICLTNINRQLHALQDTVGQAKTAVMAERLRAISPEVTVDAFQAFYDAESSNKLLAGGFDYVLDCIDHVTSKLHLLQTCREKKLPVIASMGAANKLDPSRIKVADLFATRSCRLARILRKELRRRGINNGIKAVFSDEEYRPPAQNTAICKSHCICPNREEQVWNCRHLRLILGSSSYIPPLFGLTMAGEVIRALLARADALP